MVCLVSKPGKGHTCDKKDFHETTKTTHSNSMNALLCTSWVINMLVVVVSAVDVALWLNCVIKIN